MERLRSELRRSRFDGDINVAALSAGEPAGYLPLLHHALLGCSRALASWRPRAQAELDLLLRFFSKMIKL